MKIRMMIVAVVLFLTVGIAFGADIDGKWTGKYDTGMGGDPMNMEYTFKAEGDVLTGTTIGGANGGQIPIIDGKIDGKKISFAVMVDMMGQAMKFNYTGELSKDRIKLKFETGGNMGSSGSFTINRVKEKEKKKKK